MDRGIYKKAIELYKCKQKTRQELCKMFNLNIRKFNNALWYSGIELWDKRKLNRQSIDEIIKLYKSGISRKELISKYDLTKTQLNNYIYKNGITVWDKKNRVRKTKKPSKYFSWAEIKNHPILSYNKEVVKERRLI